MIMIPILFRATYIQGFHGMQQILPAYFSSLKKRPKFQEKVFQWKNNENLGSSQIRVRSFEPAK